jgi:hypothetical protein
MNDFDSLNHKINTSGLPASDIEYICMQCHWKGKYQELDWDTVDTCMGNDKVEICPQCGSMELIIQS